MLIKKMQCLYEHNISEAQLTDKRLKESASTSVFYKK